MCAWRISPHMRHGRRTSAFFHGCGVIRTVKRTAKALRPYPANQRTEYSTAEKIVESAKRNGATVSGPIPLPTKKEVVTILRAVHKYKDSREQFERRTHKRLIDILNPNAKCIEALQGLDLPAGVEIEIKL